MTSPTTRFSGKLVYVRFKDFTFFMDDFEVWFNGREFNHRRLFDNSEIEKFIEEARETLRLKEIGQYPILRYSLTPSTAPLTEFFSASPSGSSPGVPSAPPQPFSTSSSFSSGVSSVKYFDKSGKLSNVIPINVGLCVTANDLVVCNHCKEKETRVFDALAPDCCALVLVCSSCLEPFGEISSELDEQGQPKLVIRGITQST